MAAKKQHHHFVWIFLPRPQRCVRTETLCAEASRGPCFHFFSEPLQEQLGRLRPPAVCGTWVLSLLWAHSSASSGLRHSLWGSAPLGTAFGKAQVFLQLPEQELEGTWEQELSAGSGVADTPLAWTARASYRVVLVLKLSHKIIWEALFLKPIALSLWDLVQNHWCIESEENLAFSFFFSFSLSPISLFSSALFFFFFLNSEKMRLFNYKWQSCFRVKRVRGVLSVNRMERKTARSL